PGSRQDAGALLLNCVHTPFSQKAGRCGEAEGSVADCNYPLLWNRGGPGVYPGGMPFLMNGKSSGLATSTWPSIESSYGTPSGSTGTAARCSAPAISHRLVGMRPLA